MQKDTGFTLFELMVVMAMIGLLVAITVPSMISWRSNSKLNGAALNLRGDLEMAKARAITENASVAVLFNANGYTIFFDNGAGANANNWNLDGDELLLRNRQLPPGVTIDLAGTTFTNNRTRYVGKGTLDIVIIPHAIERVIIKNTAGSTKIVEVLFVGRIRIQ